MRIRFSAELRTTDQSKSRSPGNLCVGSLDHRRQALKALIELRDVGGWLKIDHHLRVGGRRRTKLVDDMGWQVDAVRNALGYAHHIRVRPGLCFVDGEWKLFAKPFELRGVLVSWPKKFNEMISEEGPLSPEEVLAVAGFLGNALPRKDPITVRRLTEL